MARARITRGTVGPVAVVPMGIAVDGAYEQVIPPPANGADEALPYPKGWQAGKSYKVAAGDGTTEFTVTRWRGLARVTDVDGKQYMIRRWRDTRSAAVAATERAGLDRLEELAASRDRAQAAARRSADGDTTTTVGELLERVTQTPGYAKLAARTRDEYSYTLAQMMNHDQGALGATLPRYMDVARVRAFLESFAAAHGTNGAVRAKALLRKAMDLATESAAMHVTVNVVTAARDVIPNVKVQQRKHRIDHTPTDEEVTVFLQALRRDPAAVPMLGARRKSRHGNAGSVVNGTDVADLLALTFGTGLRVGEACGLRWKDLSLDDGAGTASVSGTVVWIKGEGTVRQPRTKTKGSERTVPLRADLVQMLRERAEQFEIKMDDAKHRELPVFPSPQHHDRWRQPGNLMKAIRAAMDRHGLDWASSHTARRWRVTSLLDRGVPLGKVSDVVGHTELRTTLKYVGRGRGTDDDVRAAL